VDYLIKKYFTEYNKVYKEFIKAFKYEEKL